MPCFESFDTIDTSREKTLRNKTTLALALSFSLAERGHRAKDRFRESDHLLSVEDPVPASNRGVGFKKNEEVVTPSRFWGVWLFLR